MTQKCIMFYILRRVCYIIFMILLAGALMENILNSKIYAENVEIIKNSYMKFTEEIKNIYKIYEENNRLENFCGITVVPWTTLLLTFLAVMITCFFIFDPIIRRIGYVIGCCFTTSNSLDHTDKTSRRLKQTSYKYYILPDNLLM